MSIVELKVGYVCPHCAAKGLLRFLLSDGSVVVGENASHNGEVLIHVCGEQK